MRTQVVESDIIVLAQLKNVTDADGRAELLARIGAWWDGKDFDPETMKNAGASASKSSDQDEAPNLKPLPKGKNISKPPPRVGALENIWGRGRFMPGDGVFDSKLIDALGRVRGRIGKVGLLGVDSVSTDVLAAAAGEEVELVEWRKPCGLRSSQIVENAHVKTCDLDRVNVFEDSSLKALLSVEVMSFVDHKAGLSARMHRALREGGRWAIVDYVVKEDFTPKASFASSWAEPQLLKERQLESHLETTGFQIVSKQDVTGAVINAARAAFARLGPMLEDLVAEGVKGKEGALMMQELSWEAAAWRARLKLLEKGALQVVIWIAEKPGAQTSEEVVPPIAAETAAVKEEPSENEWKVEEGSDVSADMKAAIAEAENEDDGWDAEEETEELDQSAVDSLFD